MRINITLILQIINFGVTYWFLNKFMFRPVVNFLQKRAEKEKNQVDRINRKERHLLELEEKKHEELVFFRFRMQERYSFAPVKTPELPTKLFYRVDRDEAGKLTEKIKKMLVKRVPHVN
jgi:hypothetical protein